MEESEKINKIKKAIEEHGFLLEEEVKDILKRDGWECESSPHYMDQDTGKSREMDIYASKEEFPVVKQDTRKAWLKPILIIQCKDHKSPLVLFMTTKSKKDKDYWYELSGLLSSKNAIIFPELKNEGQVKSPERVYHLADFLEIDKVHHFFMGLMKATNISKSVEKNNFSLEDNGIYDKFVIPLIKSTTQVYKDKRTLLINSFPETVGERGYYLIIPVLVYGGDIYSTELINGDLTVGRTHYEQLITQYSSSKIVGLFQIDVVSRDYFPSYLREKVNKTIGEIRKKLKEKFDDVIVYENDFDFLEVV